MYDLGIRREYKNRWERRAPLIPDHVRELVRDQGVRVAVQSSPLRIFSDDEYRAVGAEIVEGLEECRVILGLKEVPPERVIPRKPQLFFAHVTKGQEATRPMLRRILEAGCTLIDYEHIVDRHGRRLVFFGRHAGYAGMIDALWAYGQRMLVEGYETAFAAVKRAYDYPSVDAAAEFLTANVARRMRERGLRPEIHPFVVGFTGGGNVSQGAQEIFDRLPVLRVDPEDLPRIATQPGTSRQVAYKVVFRREHRVNFAQYLPFLTILVNGIYWSPTRPRLVTRADLLALQAATGAPKLRVIADITCDVDGSIEATVRANGPDDPVFVYDPRTGEATSGVTGDGPVVLAVDNLPAELPRDASEHFGDGLYPFVGSLLAADFAAEFEFLTLPSALSGAVIVHKGELAPRYRHLEKGLR